ARPRPGAARPGRRRRPPPPGSGRSSGALGCSGGHACLGPPSSSTFRGGRSMACRDPRTRPDRPARVRQRRFRPRRPRPYPQRRHRIPHRPAPGDRPGGGAQPPQGAARRAARRSAYTGRPRTPGVVVDPDVDLVVELIGGVEPARELVLAALKAGKPVVTGNKELLAVAGAELFAAAEAAGVDLLFEAAVGGGIPFIRPLRESL